MSLFQAIPELKRVSQVTKENTDSSVKVNKETGFSDAFKALGFSGLPEKKADPVTETPVEDTNKRPTQPDQTPTIPPKVEEIKVCTEFT